MNITKHLLGTARACVGGAKAFTLARFRVAYAITCTIARANIFRAN